MKSIGIVRKIDELGRLVVPKEMRKALDINCNDPVEITNEGDRIILRKHLPRCIFCAADTELLSVKGKKICKSCLNEIAK